MISQSKIQNLKSADSSQRAGAGRQGDQMKRALEFVERKTKSTGTISQPCIITGQGHGLSLAAEKLHRGQMKGVQRSYRPGKRFQRSDEHRGSHLDERETTQQCARFVSVRSRQLARVNARPELVLDEPAGDQLFLPESFGRL